jgi:hypothetical protein
VFYYLTGSLCSSAFLRAAPCGDQLNPQCLLMRQERTSSIRNSRSGFDPDCVKTRMLRFAGAAGCPKPCPLINQIHTRP